MQPVAVITGASQGLGLEIARRLAERGYRLVLDARRADRLAAAVSELAGRTTVEGIPGDVTDPEHRRRLADAARRLGRTTALVNNASTLGATPLPPIDALDPAVLRQTFETNVVAPVALYQEIAGELEPGAVVVNVTSDAAVEGYPGWGGYGASKAALEQVGRVLAAERPDLRVLTVDPGDMRTELHQLAFPGEDISDRPTPDASAEALVALIESDRPSGRYTTTEVDAAIGAPR